MAACGPCFSPTYVSVRRVDNPHGGCWLGRALLDVSTLQAGAVVNGFRGGHLAARRTNKITSADMRASSGGIKPLMQFPISQARREIAAIASRASAQQPATSLDMPAASKRQRGRQNRHMILAAS